jgi:maltose/moltooligosaccharide transporter
MSEAPYTEKDGKWFDQDGRQVWRAGTLVYYKRDLIRMFFWLYIGQFTFWMEHIAFPTLFPLLMMKKGFNAAQIGSLWSIFPLGALIVFPILGTWSDRARTRWGRRRPFDLFTTPIWFVGLVMLPFITTYWQALSCMVLIGFAGAGSNVLTGFYNDVVPPELMGRFVAGMRMLGSFGGLLVQLVALRLFDMAPFAVFVGIVCIGFAGEMLMLFMVKEGEYPPPPPKQSVLKVVGGFLKEGFANRYIIFLWLTLGVTALGGPVMATYFNLFFTDSTTGLGLSATQLGYILATGSAIGLCLILPAGWVIDRVGPKKIWGWCGLLVGATQIMMFLFAHSVQSVAILYAVFAAINTMMTASLLPMMYSFIPKEKFGQLNGASQIVSRVLQIVGANACGLMIVAVGQQYRYAFIFGGIAYMLTPLFLFLMLKQPWPYGSLKSSMHPDGKRGLARDGREVIPVSE